MARRRPLKHVPVTPVMSAASPTAAKSHNVFMRLWSGRGDITVRLLELARLLWLKHGFAPLVPLFVTFLVSPSRVGFEYNIKAPINPFDEGLLLVLRRFSSLSMLPYRDLWTLYGPGQSLLAPLFNIVAGRNILAHRLINILLLEALVLLLYIACGRFVSRWIASVFALIIGLVALPLSYLSGLVFLFSGTYLAFFPAKRESGGYEGPKDRRVWAGTCLIALALLGRLEYGLLAGWALLVILVLCYRRKSARWIRNTALASIAPGFLFLIYLASLPREVVIENFFRYPFRYYPLTTCRGTPVDWRAIGRLFFGMPFKGLWNEYELVLVCCFVILPALGISLMALSAVSRFTAFRPLLLFLGGCDLFGVWSMISKQGHYPTPAMPLVLVSLALLSFVCGIGRPNLGRRVAVCSAVFLGFGIIPQFIPGALASWKSWPPYHPIIGFGERNAKTLFNASLYETIAADVDRILKPGERIFVALDHNRGHFANVAALYWALDRPPASRFIEFDPCLTDREDVQQLIVRDLAKVKVIITTNFFQQADFSSPPAHSLDDYISQNFRQERIYQLPGQAEAYKLLVRGVERFTSGPAVSNGSFEGGSLTSWAPWSSGTDGAMTATIECSKSYHESCGLQETGGSGTVFQDVGGLIVGCQYEITAWALSDPGTTAKAALWVHDTAAGNDAIDGSRTPDSKHWERFSASFLASQTSKVRIHLNHDGGSGAIYWDDVAILKVE